APNRRASHPPVRRTSSPATPNRLVLDLVSSVPSKPPWQDAENVRQLCSRIAQRLNVEEERLGGRKHSRGFSVRQDVLRGRTAHTKCGTYLLASSLAAAALDGHFEHPA